MHGQIVMIIRRMESIIFGALRVLSWWLFAKSTVVVHFYKNISPTAFAIKLVQLTHNTDCRRYIEFVVDLTYGINYIAIFTYQLHRDVFNQL